MHAQLVRNHTTGRTRSESHRIVSGEVIRARHDEPGFAGALNLVKPRTGEAIMIVLRQTAEQTQRPLDDANVFAPLLRIPGASPGDQQAASMCVQQGAANLGRRVAS